MGRIAGMVAGATEQTTESMQAIQGNVTNVTDWAANLMAAVWNNGLHLEFRSEKFPFLGSLSVDVSIPHPEIKEPARE